eukprot:346090-Chlamydomonas_euryale.AAC.3
MDGVKEHQGAVITMMGNERAAGAEGQVSCDGGGGGGKKIACWASSPVSGWAPSAPCQGSHALRQRASAPPLRRSLAARSNVPRQPVTGTGTHPA